MVNLLKKIFYPPNYISMPKAGVDISNREIKFIEFSDKKGKISIKNYGEVKLAENIIKDGEILNRNLLIKSLSEIKNKISTDFISTSIPEEKTYIFNVEIPNVEDSLIKQSIEFRLEENVPFKVTEVYFEYEIIKASKNIDENILVSVSVIPKKIISEYTEIFNLAGFFVVDFQIESRMIARSITTKDNKIIMVVDIKSDSTVLSIVDKNIVLLTSSIPLGESSIRDNLMKTDHSIYNDEKISDEIFSFKTSYDDENFSSILNTFSILKDEIEKFNNYLIFKSSNKKSFLPNHVDKIILCGRSSALPGFSNHITQNFDIEVVSANVWVNVFDLNEHIPSINFIDSLDFAACVGLALPSIKN